jgi:hypothetical protein
MGLELGSFGLVSTIEELLGRKSSGSGLENREYGCAGRGRGLRAPGVSDARQFGAGYFSPLSLHKMKH